MYFFYLMPILLCFKGLLKLKKSTISFSFSFQTFSFKMFWSLHYTYPPTFQINHYCYANKDPVLSNMRSFFWFLWFPFVVVYENIDVKSIGISKNSIMHYIYYKVYVEKLIKLVFLYDQSSSETAEKIMFGKNYT